MGASEDAGPGKGWIVISHISWGEEQNTLYKCVEKDMETASGLKLETLFLYIYFGVVITSYLLE